METIAGFTAEPMFEESRLPLVLRPAGDDCDLAGLARAHRDTLSSKLLEHGALLFRGFGVHGAEHFDRVAGAFSEDRARYVYRSTPRTSVGNGIYTATEYPPDRQIPLHNENSYQRSWPLRVAFCCIRPAAGGGETPLADMRRVSAAVGAELFDAFASRRVRYIRHYYPHYDLAWQEVFQTDDRNALSRYCEENDIAHEWIDEETLRTVQVCQGTTRHPVTGDHVFFNQAHLFHVSSLGRDTEEMMLEVFGRDRLPRHACYGDGAEIGFEDIERIASAFRSEAISFAWSAGDVLLLDNMQVAHGRHTFTGERKVLAALLDTYAASVVS